MATGPRPYGRGTYGTGRYSIYSDGLMIVGAATQIRFSPQAKINYTWVVPAASSISFGVVSFPTLIAVSMATTQISFSLRGRASLVFNEAAPTQIRFSLQGELVSTWKDPGPCFEPCQPGTWTQTFPPWVERMAA